MFDPGLEMQRLEVGLVISGILQAQRQKVMDSTRHPNDAFNEAKFFRDLADKWKHWATVKVGHMVGL